MVTQSQGAFGVAQTQLHSQVQVCGRTNLLLTHIAGNVDDASHNALRHKAARIADDAQRFFIQGEDHLSGLLDVLSQSRVGRKHTPACLLVIKEHVDADGSGRVQSLEHAGGGDIKAQRRDQSKRLGARLGGRFNLDAQVFEQLVQRRAPGRPG